MTVPIESAAASTNKQPISGLNIMDPKHMIVPVYGHSNVLTSSICAGNLRPITPRSPLKGATRSSASPFRQMFPLIVGIISFATVLSILIVFMDTTEIRHQQFRLNMSRDDEMHDVEQDDPELVSFIREYHLNGLPPNFLKSHQTLHSNYIERLESVPSMAKTLASFVDMKKNGIFVQSLTGQSGALLTAPWLAENLNWGGLIIEPEPRKYFSLGKENAMRPKVRLIEACLSPNIHPKEITLRNGGDDNDVRINSLVDGETLWFNSRVKCFPLYTLMLAVNETNIDLLSLGCQGQELEILETIPFDKVSIKVISIHLDEYYNSRDSLSFGSGTTLNHSSDDYHKKVWRFLESKSYKLAKVIDHNYIYHLVENKNSKKTNNLNPNDTK